MDLRKVIYCLPVIASIHFMFMVRIVHLVNPENYPVKRKEIYGFIRGGVYAGLDHEDNNNPYVSSAFSDFGLKFGMGNGINYKAHGRSPFQVWFGVQGTGKQA